STEGISDVGFLTGLNFVRVPIGRTSNIESIDWQLADIHLFLMIVAITINITAANKSITLCFRSESVSQI
ncbi:MAG: hypothetical protein ACM687_03905, partial [Bacteroidales bacterium]